MSYNKETGMYEGYIYCITNKVNGKQYIGQTVRDIETRWKDHSRKYKNNIYNLYLYTSMNKYGFDNFSISLVKKISYDTKKCLKFNLDKIEIFYIKHFNCLKPNGYNMTKGGDCAGNTITEKQVFQYDLSGKLINFYNSVNECSRCTGIDQSDISNCCLKKKVKTAGGFVFRFEQSKINIDSTESRKYRKIDQYDMFGNYLTTYNCVKDALKIICNYHCSISNCLNNRATQSFGYVWRYHNETIIKLPKRIPYRSVCMCEFIKIADSNIANKLKMLGFTYMIENINNQDIFVFKVNKELIAIINDKFFTNNFIYENKLRF